MNDTVAVVPIFVNAGTALLPAIVAPVASALALLVNPRELFRLFKRRPIIPVLLVVGAVLIWVGISWATTTPAPNRNIAPTDWSKIARELISNRPPTTLAATKTPSGTVGFRHGFTRCGHDGGPSPLALRPAWQFNPEGTMFLSSPTVADGRVYGASCTIDFAGNFGTIFCLDAKSGSRPIWETRQLDSKDLKPFFSSPAITADRKYLLIGQGLHEDADGNLLCLDAETGAIRWKIPTPLHIESSPAILGDMVVAGAGAIEGPDHKPKTDIGFVLAARISDGKELWRFAVNDPESSPAISPDGTVYIGSGFQGNAIVALRSQSDEELKAKNLPRQIWRTALPYPITGAITLIDDLAIVGGGNGDYVYGDPNPAGIVVALDAKTGVIRWQAKMPDAVLGAVPARDGKVICPVRNGQVVALKLTDGGKLWEQRVSGNTPVLAAPAFTGDYIYAVSRDGCLVILSVKDGSVIERHDINDATRPGKEGFSVSSPTIANGCLFVGSETGGLRCFAGDKTQP